MPGRASSGRSVAIPAGSGALSWVPHLIKGAGQSAQTSGISMFASLMMAGPAFRHRHKSITMSPSGSAQQISTLPSAGASIGSGPVADRPGYEPGLAGVADPCPARPSHRHVASLGQLEQALECWPPADAEAAPGERDQRPLTLKAQPANAAAGAAKPRCPASSDGPAPNISVWMRFRRDAQGCKAGGQIAHEGRRPADIEVAIRAAVQLLGAHRMSK